MKTKYFVLVTILGMLLPFGVARALENIPYDYCRVTGTLEGVSRGQNTDSFVMLYKIKKVEQKNFMPGYDCHGFVVGATAGLGLDRQMPNDFSIKVGQNFEAIFDRDDKFVGFSDIQSATCLNFSNDLAYSNTSPDVTRLQQYLKDNGYLNATATGYFGSMTRSALAAFQKDYSLLVTGKLDFETRAKVKALTCSSNITKAKAGEVCNPPAIECESGSYCSYPLPLNSNGVRPTGMKGTCLSEMVTMKPVIYLYPENKQQVSVKLSYNGTLSASLPAYDKKIGGWQVTAYPDGKIINADGREYSYLFWDGLDNIKYDMSSGFVVKGADTVEFLRDSLSKMGLTPKEYNEFIVFWYPKMQENSYNLIHFAGEEYTDNAKLEISPKPDSVQRVFMVWQGLDNPISVRPQDLKTFERKGFSVIEWGGKELEK